MYYRFITYVHSFLGLVAVIHGARNVKMLLFSLVMCRVFIFISVILCSTDVVVLISSHECMAQTWQMVLFWMCRHTNGLLYSEYGLGTRSCIDVQTISSWKYTTVDVGEIFDGIQITSDDLYFYVRFVFRPMTSYIDQNFCLKESTENSLL